MSAQPIALIIGAGDHLGSAIARRFAKEGFHIVATRRRGDLSALERAITELGADITALHSDAREEDQVIQLIEDVESRLGPIEICVFNIGGNVRYGITETSAQVYRKVWEMCSFAGFLIGREVSKRMLTRQRGSILFTGASASLRGSAGFSAFAGGKHALRALAQSMARELGPQGIHVGHIVVDGIIDNRNTEAVMPELFASKGPDGVIQPDDLAELYWQLHQQPRSAWTFELDARPYKETW
jgi:NAD(P)-dependent dehydrogenase (short-subunit alcohol dehydrogenase family)